MNIILKIGPKVVVDNSTEVPDDALHLKLLDRDTSGRALCGYKLKNMQHSCFEGLWNGSKFCPGCGRPVCSICICEAILLYT